MNINEPLGLPRGSVRALISIGVLGSFVAACFFDVPEGSLTALSSLAGVVLRDYFSSRKDKEDNDIDVAIAKEAKEAN